MHAPARSVKTAAARYLVIAGANIYQPASWSSLNIAEHEIIHQAVFRISLVI